MNKLLAVEIRFDQDVVNTRQRARQLAGLLGFSNQEQTAVATAVSEVARNAFRYAGGGKAEFQLEEEPPMLSVVISDRGQGIANLEEVLSGSYSSTTGMGIGLVGSRRLCDRFDIDTSRQGTTVTLGKRLPKRAPLITPQLLGAIWTELARRGPLSPLDEVQMQNRELLQALEALQSRQAEVERLNAELAETNRGVLALYAELDEKAESLRRASELKSRFLSDMSHELRTPLNAMVSLSSLLLERVDGELTPEQERQVRFIRTSAQSLGEMVNDLLDLAKIEAGKVDLHLSEFAVSDVMSALRGMFRPLAPVGGAVSLIFEDGNPVLTLYSDERKVSQVLRNFVSNALKFTEHGEVRVRVVPGPSDTVIFAVSDTGVGIAPEDQRRVFEDYTQIDGAVQRRSRGTGLGLPLTRKLARLLGGRVSLVSEPGVGSTFYFELPIRYRDNTPAGSAMPPQTTLIDSAGGADGTHVSPVETQHV